MVAAELVLAPFAAAMAAITAYLIAWAAEARTRVAAAVIAFLLAMMVAMLVGALLYYLDPGPARLVEGLWVAGAIMSVSVFPLFFVVQREAQLQIASGGSYVPSRLLHLPPYVALVIGLVLVNELLMGWVFALAAGQLLPPAGADPVPLLTSIVATPWFLFTMSAEMALTAYWLRGRVGPALFALLAAQAGIMLLSPPALADGTWAWTSLLAGSALMIALFVGLMELTYQRRELNSAFARYVVRLLVVYGGMMAGLYLWIVDRDLRLFALAVAVEMVLFFDVVLRPEPFQGTDRIAWQLHPRWAFSLLAGIFLAELFMGAALDAMFHPESLVASGPPLPVSGPLLLAVPNALTNGFWFFANVTASTFFLAMMGFEMGTLVVFKLRETVPAETRARILLMMGCYGAFAVFYPSLYYHLVFPSAPRGTQVAVLGWSMGLGSAPVAPAVFAVILGSYAITGTLAVLFGRRVVCSTFCTAPFMFQGNAIDRMSSFNRTSPLARKYLSSRFSSMYTATTGVVLVALAATSILSYFDQIGRLDVRIAGADPSVFLFALSFSVLWYVMFVTIPYTGNYNCVTMGYCYTGAILQAFHKVGFFKLKVRDREVCRACTTLDCAKTCPVGLVDMPGHFRKTGEFTSTKCCGVGNCVGACPYHNLYIYDVRHALSERFGLRRTAAPLRPLPMAAGPRPPPAPGAAAHADTAPVR